MRIGIVSDTHVSVNQVPAFIELVSPFMRGVAAILHAGDLTAPELLDALETLAPVSAVSGNMDGDVLLGRCPEKTVVELGGRRIGLIHGWGAPDDLLRRVGERFLNPKGEPTVEVLVFGHSHQPMVEHFKGMLCVNPGSPTDKRFSPYRSIAFLETEPLEAHIIHLP